MTVATIETLNWMKAGKLVSLSGLATEPSPSCHAATIRGQGDIPPQNELVMKCVVAGQPVGMAIEVGGGMQFYKSGVNSGTRPAMRACMLLRPLTKKNPKRRWRRRQRRQASHHGSTPTAGGAKHSTWRRGRKSQAL